MKESLDNENYIMELRREILAKISFVDPINEQENKYIQMKNDIIDYLISHEEKNKINMKDNNSETSEISRSKYISADKALIKCKLHGTQHLIIDSKKFKVECLKCLDHGERNHNLEINEANFSIASNEEQEEEEMNLEGLECHIHPEIMSDFYCDDCKVFLCKVCFTNQHRMHSSNILSEIAEKYKLSLKDLIKSINELKPKLEESSKHIGEIGKQIKGLRYNSIDTIDISCNKIISMINNKYQNFISQFDAIFMGNDLETESVVNRLESLHKIICKYMTDITDILNTITMKSKNIEICKYIISKHSRIEEIKSTIEGKRNFLFYKVNDTKNKVQTKFEEFDRLIQNVKKQIKIYQTSVLSSINTGISSSSLRLRRFCNMKYITKYFKTSSVECKFSGTICLVGLGLCGLYYNNYEENGKINEKKLELLKKNKSPIEISIKEIKDPRENLLENLLSEEHNISSIINSSDPVISIYFNKAVILKEDRKYLITCTNLNKDVLIPRWYGEVNKKLLKNKSQFVLCNTSGIGFTFSEAEGIESDFDEYYSGIIAEFIFSYI